ncbi:MAG: YcaO-like family protein [Chloroflexales bacterium]|nr:YcaO-like family protein [Chloroflexales bacterium]
MQSIGQVTAVDIGRLDAVLRTNAPAERLVVALLTALDIDVLLMIDDLCLQHNVRWVSCHFEQSVAWLGPAVAPPYTATYRDVLQRRCCAAQDLALHQALLANTTTSGILPPYSELVWLFALLYSEITRWIAGDSHRLINAELRTDPQTLTIARYPVLPLPRHQAALQTCQVWRKAKIRASQCVTGATPDRSCYESLINERAGVILHLAPVKHHPSVPAALCTVQAYLPRMQRYDTRWYNVTTSLGSSFDGMEAARRSATGEAVERYCMNYLAAAQPIRANYHQLLRRGDDALDPEHLILFSDTIYDTPGCPFVRFTRETEVYWVQGRSLTHKRTAWLPLSFIYTHWQVEPYTNQPMVNATHYPGVAAGRSLEQALVAGIEELIERDSMMVWWLNRQPLPAVGLTPELRALWSDAPTEHGQRAWAIPLTNEFGMPVIAGVVEQTQEQLLTIGFACRPDPYEATRKAWAEALTLQERSRDLNAPTSALRRELAMEGAASVIKPWRADRAYMDDYRTDFRDLTHTVCAEQFYLDPRAIERVRPWVDVPAGTTFDAIPAPPDRTLATYQRRLAAQGYEVFYYDLTTSDIRLAGWHVVRVLIPGFIPEFPAAFPHTGGGRAQRAAVRLGWRNTPLAETELNTMPLPYA